jgi:hypothetical protein
MSVRKERMMMRGKLETNVRKEKTILACAVFPTWYQTSVGVLYDIHVQCGEVGWDAALKSRYRICCSESVCVNSISHPCHMLHPSAESSNVLQRICYF